MIVYHYIIWAYSIYLAVLLLWICRLYPIWTIVNNIEYLCKTCSHLWLFPWINIMNIFWIRTSEFLSNTVLPFLRILRLITKLFSALSAHFMGPCHTRCFYLLPCLSFYICKMEIIIGSTSKGCRETMMSYRQAFRVVIPSTK